MLAYDLLMLSFLFVFVRILRIPQDSSGIRAKILHRCFALGVQPISSNGLGSRTQVKTFKESIRQYIIKFRYFLPLKWVKLDLEGGCHCSQVLYIMENVCMC